MENTKEASADPDKATESADLKADLALSDSDGDAHPDGLGLYD